MSKKFRDSVANMSREELEKRLDEKGTAIEGQGKYHVLVSSAVADALNDVCDVMNEVMQLATSDMTLTEKYAARRVLSAVAALHNSFEERRDEAHAIVKRMVERAAPELKGLDFAVAVDIVHGEKNCEDTITITALREQDACDAIH